MRGSIRAEKQSEGGWANESEGRLPKAESAGFGGSPAIRAFTIILRNFLVELYDGKHYIDFSWY